MKKPSFQWAIIAALTGAVLLFAGTVTTVVAYREGMAEGYSVANHFVSELGWVKVSRTAWLFNGSLAVGVLAFLPAVIALGRHLQTRLGCAATGFGACAIFAGSSIGLVPMDNLKPHLGVALLFFVAWFLTTLTFTAAFWPRWSPRPSRAMVVAGTLCCLLDLIFLALPKASLIKALQDLDAGRFQRPRIWWLTVAEWCVVLSAFLWALTAISVLWRSRPVTPEELPTTDAT